MTATFGFVRAPYYNFSIDYYSFTEVATLHEFVSYNRKVQLAFLDQRKDIIEQLRLEKFDMIIHEQYVWAPTILAELLNIPVKIWVSSCPVMDHHALMTGIPSEYSYVPVIYNSLYTDKMTLYERFLNTLQGHLLAAMYYYEFHTVLVKELEQRYG